ncbi:alpha/beta hydrolase [Candidatus Gottesmanbacteria bacterium]|nr:alpha/beta hydrolase [Candidatus Gottesmanbacteria bacterium]
MKRQSIIILHGWGLSGERFLPLAEELRARGYTAYVPDMPGFGASSVPKNSLTLADYANFLNIFIQKHDIRNPVLIGHSFGGRVSIKYNMMYPKIVRALILTGTPGFTPVNRKKLLLFIFLAKVGGAFWSLPPFCLFREFVQKWYYYAVGARDFYRAEGSMRQTFKNIVQEDLELAMKSVKIPCLLLWGGQDTIVPISIAHKMAAIMGTSTLITIPDFGHNVPYRNSARFAHLVAQFIHRI